MAVHVTNFTADAQASFLGPWADAQLYKRSGLTRYHEDLTPMLEARGPTANGLQLTRDATTGYFTEITDTASNAAFTPITNVLEDFTLTLDETKNIDLVFNYSENEIAALQSLGVWAQNQMGRINAVASTRAAKVYDALTNNTTGAGLAANKTTHTIADASNFLGAGGNTEKGERLAALLWMVNANLTLWDRGLDMFGDGSGSGGPGEVVFLVNRTFFQALNYYQIADTPNGGTGIRYDSTLQRGRIEGAIGDNVVIIDHHMDNVLTAAGDQYLAIAFHSRAIKGLWRRNHGFIEAHQMDPATGNPTPIKVMGTRYAYAYGLPDSNLVLSLDSAVTAN